MRENKNIFDNAAGDALRNFEQEPPAGMWERIEGGIKRRHRKIIFFRYGSIAATLLILLSTGIYFLNEQTAITGKQFTQTRIDADNNNPVKKEPSKTSDTEKTGTSGKTVITKTLHDKAAKANNKDSEGSSVKGDKAVKVGKPDIKLKDNKTPRKNYRILNNTHISQERNKLQSEKQAIDLSIISRDELTLAEMPVLKGDYNSIESPIKPQIALKETDLAFVGSPLLPEESRAGAWSLALGYGMTSGSDLTQNEETFESRGSKYSYDDFSAQLANQTSFFEEIDNTIHDAPVAIGLVVGKGLSNRISLETGVIYTRLAFRIQTDDLSPFYRKYRNEMFYLGVPAGVRYSFLKREKFNFYALQWGVVEKGIAGRWHIDTYNNNEITDSESKVQIIRGIQFSTITALGGQFKLAGNIYLFGQGGIQVFYLNKTQPFNIRSQKVAWPSIQAGLRVDF